MRNTKMRYGFLSVIFVLLFSVSMNAAEHGKYGQFSNIYVFGDSLSDNGNFTKILGPIEQFFQYYYWEGRWSNGPVWVEYLAKEAHSNLINFAVGTATTGDTTHGMFYPYVPTVLDQIQSFCDSEVTIPPDSLFIVEGGYNDFIINPFGSPESAVDNIMAGVALLKEAGAKQILVVNLIDMGTLPLMKRWGLSAWMSMVTAEYNNALTGAVSNFAAANPDIPISIGDFYAIGDAQLSMPEKYSLKNVTDESPNAAQANEQIDYASKHYFFWDFIHPTTRVHEALADFVGKSLKDLAKQITR